MKCTSVRRWLERDLDGAAEPSGDVAAHLEQCVACRTEAGRLKALAESARAALPPADVPLDFTEEVVAALVSPTSDGALIDAARPRVRRWLPVLAAAALVIPALFLLRGNDSFRGAVSVERDGEWVDADSAEFGETFGLPALGSAAYGGLRMKALSPSVVLAARPVELRAGEVLIETKEPAVVRTELAEIHLQANSAVLLTLSPKGDEMNFRNLNRLAPGALAVTMLAGGATVVNAQGEERAECGQNVSVLRGDPPALDLAAVEREFTRLAERLAKERARLAEVRRQIAAAEGRIVRNADGPAGKPVVIDTAVRHTDGPAGSKPDVIDTVEDAHAAISLGLLTGHPQGPAKPKPVRVVAPPDPNEPDDPWLRRVYRARHGNYEAQLELAKERERIAMERVRLEERIAAIEAALGKGTLDELRRDELRREKLRFAVHQRRVEEVRAKRARNVQPAEVAKARADAVRRDLAAQLEVVADGCAGARRRLIWELERGTPPWDGAAKEFRRCRTDLWKMHLTARETDGNVEPEGMRELYLEVERALDAVRRIRELVDEADGLHEEKKFAEADEAQKLMLELRADLLRMLKSKQESKTK